MLGAIHHGSMFVWFTRVVTLCVSKAYVPSSLGVATTIRSMGTHHALTLLCQVKSKAYVPSSIGVTITIQSMGTHPTPTWLDQVLNALCNRVGRCRASLGASRVRVLVLIQGKPSPTYPAPHTHTHTHKYNLYI